VDPKKKCNVDIFTLEEAAQLDDIIQRRLILTRRMGEVGDFNCLGVPVDPRCIVWPTCRFTKDDGYVATFNRVLSAVFACNNCVLHVGSASAAIAISFYIANYMTKEGLKLDKSLPIIQEMIEKSTKKTSTCDDAETLERKTKFLFQVIVNGLSSKTELSAPAAASMILGHASYWASMATANIFPHRAVDYNREAHGDITDAAERDEAAQLVDPVGDEGADEESDDEYETEVNELGETIAVFAEPRADSASKSRTDDGDDDDEDMDILLDAKDRRGTRLRFDDGESAFGTRGGAYRNADAADYQDDTDPHARIADTDAAAQQQQQQQEQQQRRAIVNVGDDDDAAPAATPSSQFMAARPVVAPRPVPVQKDGRTAPQTFVMGSDDAPTFFDAVVCYAFRGAVLAHMSYYE
jgi:hypothetical protein